MKVAEDREKDATLKASRRAYRDEHESSADISKINYKNRIMELILLKIKAR